VVGGRAGALAGSAIGSVVPGVGTAVGGAVGGTAGAIGGAVVGSGAGSWAADQASDLSAGLGQRIVQGAAHSRRATEGMRDTVGDVAERYQSLRLMSDQERAILVLVIAAVAGAGSVAAWMGWWRSWARQFLFGAVGSWPITLMPSMALLFLASALVSVGVLSGLSVVLGVASMFLKRAGSVPICAIRPPR
jgi:hypothetical protein